MRTRARVAATAFAVCSIVLLSAVASWASPPSLDGEADEDAVALTARTAEAAYRDFLATAKSPEVRLVEYQRAPLCNVTGVVLVAAIGRECAPSDSTVKVSECVGLEPVPPLWTRTRSSAGDAWSEWRFVTGWSCPQDALPAFTAADFRRLPLAPSPLWVQPPDGWTLVGTPAIVHTDPGPQTLTTTLLGYPVTVRARPVRWSWDFGDGAPPLRTRHPGRAYPHTDLTHTYTTVATVRITLRTTWTGRYQLAGASSWAPIDGTATTTTTSGPLDVLELRSHLVEGPCTPQQTTAGCP